MNKKILLTGIICSFFLTGCSSSIEEKSEADSPAAIKGSSNIQLLDQPFEQITFEEWESIYLDHSDFDRFLSQLSAGTSDGNQKIVSVKMEREEINIILNNRDGESLDNLIAAPAVDTKVRQVYIRSAYYEGQQPNIIITDLSGLILSNVTEPLDPIYP